MFMDLVNGKEYDHGDLESHNHKMIVDDWYKFSYYSKCMMYSLRYKFLSFQVDVILTAFGYILSFFQYPCICNCILSYDCARKS